MKKRYLALSLLFVVFACAGFDYRFYGVNSRGLDTESQKKVKLIAGQRGDRNKTLADFPNGSEPELICTPTEEFRLMREEIIEHRAEK